MNINLAKNYFIDQFLINYLTNVSTLKINLQISSDHIKDGYLLAQKEVHEYQQSNQNDSTAFLIDGYLNYKLEKYFDALYSLSNAINSGIPPDNFIGYLLKGIVCVALDEHEEALINFEQAADLAIGYNDIRGAALYYQAGLLYNSSNFSFALSKFELAHENFDHPYILFCEGKTQLTLGNYFKALNIFIRVIDSEEARSDQKFLQEIRSEIKKAITYAEQISEKQNLNQDNKTEQPFQLLYDDILRDKNSLIKQQRDEISSLRRQLGFTLLSDATDENKKLVLPEKAPELYAERRDKNEDAIAFFYRVYGDWLDAGVKIYQDNLRGKNGIDPELMQGIINRCRTKEIRAKGIKVADIVPRKDARIDASLNKENIKRARRLLTNVYRRNKRTE